MSSGFVKLGDVCEVQNGFAFDSKYFNTNESEGMPLIRIRDILNGYTHTYYSGDYQEEYIVHKGDLLIGMDGDFNIGQWNSDDALLNQRVCRLIPSNKILPKFIYYYIPTALQEINNKTVYTTVKHLSSNQVKAILLPNQSLSEQQRIVDILDKEFEKIDRLRSNAEINLRHAKDLFQAALRTELEPKEGWAECSIGEIAEIKGGKRVPKGYKLITQRTNHPYIRVSDFNDSGSVSLNDIHFISDEVYEGIKRYTISPTDVYISIAGTIGKSGIIPDVLDGANLTENACKLVLKKGISNHFIYCCTLSDGFKEQVAKLTMQAAQPKLALTRLATIRVSIPTIDEQKRVVNTLDNINNKCKVLQENYNKTIALCDDLKQSLLRKAFNGEL